MTFNKPISRTELLNQLSEEWYANSADDIYPSTLVSAPIPNADSPPPVRPPREKAEAHRHPAETTDAHSATAPGLLRDRATAALLIGLLR